LNKKLKNILITFSLFIVTYTIIIMVILLNRDSRIEVILDTHSQTLQTYYEILQYNQKVIADVSYEETLEIQEFIDIFTKANSAKNKGDLNGVDEFRKQAQKILLSKYKFMKKKGDITVPFCFP